MQASSEALIWLGRALVSRSESAGTNPIALLVLLGLDQAVPSPDPDEHGRRERQAKSRSVSHSRWPSTCDMPAQRLRVASRRMRIGLYDLPSFSSYLSQRYGRYGLKIPLRARPATRSPCS